MAAQKPPKGQINALQRAVHGDGLRGILRAGGLEFAAARAERVQRWREPAAVSGEKVEQQASHKTVRSTAELKQRNRKKGGIFSLQPEPSLAGKESW